VFFLSLTSSFFNAINALYAKKIKEEIKDNNSFIVASFLYVAIFLGLSMPWLFSFHVTPVSLALVVLVILLDTLANVLFFMSMERIEVSKLAVYSALTPLFTFLPNTILHGFNSHVLISVLVIVQGVYLLNMKNGNPLVPLLELKKRGIY
jgi:drug/metabolite transporter (DMT)-like permease